jgi:hypothetical protein
MPDVAFKKDMMHAAPTTPSHDSVKRKWFSHASSSPSSEKGRHHQPHHRGAAEDPSHDRRQGHHHGAAATRSHKKNVVGHATMAPPTRRCSSPRQTYAIIAGATVEATTAGNVSNHGRPHAEATGADLATRA